MVYVSLIFKSNILQNIIAHVKPQKRYHIERMTDTFAIFFLHIHK